MGGTVIPSAPTPKEVRQRIIDICMSITQTTSGVLKRVELGEECAIPDDLLPALIGVSTGAVTSVQTTSDSIRVTRDYTLLVLMYRIKSKSNADQLAALDAYWSRLDELPDWFSVNARGLRLNDTGFRGVIDVGRMTDEGDAPLVTTWYEKEYSAVRYTLPVTVAKTLR